VDKARRRADPELHVVGIADLCAALSDLANRELRIRMLLQGTRPLSTVEAAVRELERNVLQRLAAVEQQVAGRHKRTGNRAVIRVAVGIAFIIAAALATWYVSGNWPAATGWLGRLLA
jgi:hypothetical protein